MNVCLMNRRHMMARFVWKLRVAAECRAIQWRCGLGGEGVAYMQASGPEGRTPCRYTQYVFLAGAVPVVCLLGGSAGGFGDGHCCVSRGGLCTLLHMVWSTFLPWMRRPFYGSNVSIDQSGEPAGVIFGWGLSIGSCGEHHDQGPAGESQPLLHSRFVI